MTEVLIALGAGVGGILIGLGLGVLWLHRRDRIRADAVRVRDMPLRARPGDIVIGIESRSRNASADYEPRMDSFDVAPAIPYPYPVSAAHPPTDIDD